MGSARHCTVFTVWTERVVPLHLRHHSRASGTPGLPSPLDLLLSLGRSLSLGLQTEVLRAPPAGKFSLAFSGPQEGNEVKRHQENS